MDLTQIRYFLALADTLNFTRAAGSCNVTQPALTKSIQKLEEELGGPLLLRERGASQLTDLGRTMLPLLRDTLEAAKLAQLGAARFHRQDLVRLQIGFGPWTPAAALRPVLAELQRCFPKLEVALREGEAGTLNQWLIGSEVDAVLTTDETGLTERANRWLLFEETVTALLHRSHPMANAASVPVDDLSDEPVVVRDTGAVPKALRGLPGVARHQAGTDEQVWTILRSSASVAFSTSQRSTPADIVGVPLHPRRTLPVHLAALPGRRPGRAADAFLKLARARSWTGPAE